MKVVQRRNTAPYVQDSYFAGVAEQFLPNTKSTSNQQIFMITNGSKEATPTTREERAGKQTIALTIAVCFRSESPTLRDWEENTQNQTKIIPT